MASVDTDSLLCPVCLDIRHDRLPHLPMPQCPSGHVVCADRVRLPRGALLPNLQGQDAQPAHQEHHRGEGHRERAEEVRVSQAISLM